MMDEHLTFFGAYREQTEAVYRTLQELFALEQQNLLNDAQHNALLACRSQASMQLARLRKLLDSIEREHRLPPPVS